ncbi:hypothetical protein A3759_04835 [Thalassolituus sp. HI0120]|nr:hypothetical protein A3759_04835 [Thalassolituus sp. HI0120]
MSRCLVEDVEAELGRRITAPEAVVASHVLRGVAKRGSGKSAVILALQPVLSTAKTAKNLDKSYGLNNVA